MDENKIIPYIEPIFRFCCKRLSNRCDAEDLASEILCHILEGMNKYQIESLDAWVWRIAHNRYARFIDDRNKNQIVLSCEDELFEIADYTDIDEETTEQHYETVFRYLHTLSSEYRNIFVDYYIGELSIRSLAKKYSLPETTIKWRLNVGRQKIRDRIGENKMDKVYKRIKWNTTSCNGSVDSDKYLYSQIARSICEAVYENPLTVEEISLRTGIPTIYIEDELPRLEYGDAVRKIGNKYATDFIIMHLKDRPVLHNDYQKLSDILSDHMEQFLTQIKDDVQKIGFYGCERDISKLGYIIVPLALRRLIWETKKNTVKLSIPPYPPRKDGGYGWFIVDEVEDQESESTFTEDPHSTGNNGFAVKGSNPGWFYYYWIWRYFSQEVKSKQGLCLLAEKNVIKIQNDGEADTDQLCQEEIAVLIANGLIRRNNRRYVCNFPLFSNKQFCALKELTEIKDPEITKELSAFIENIFEIIRLNMYSKVPKRLESQIDQRISCDMNDHLNIITGYVMENLISRGILHKPDLEKPFTDGVFYVEGEYINS